MIKANEAGTTVLMVTHSEKVAALSDRIIYLLDGDIQGELILGKMNAKNDDSLSETERVILREKKLRKWLEGLGW